MALETQLVLVTGGSSGIGKELTKRLASLGFSVVFTSRTKEKAEKTLLELQSSANAPGSIEWMVLNLDSIKSVHQFVKEFRSKHKKLDILINNAGRMTTCFELTGDGIESTFSSNHLGPFMTTLGLLPLLEAAESSRIIFVSSSAHWRIPKNHRFSDEFLNSQQHFSMLGT